MKDKNEIIEKLDELALSTLKGKYPFIYRQILADLRSKIEEVSEDISTDALTDAVNDSIHREQIDGYHEDISGGMSHEEASAIVQAHNERMVWISEIYEDFGLQDQK